MICRILVPRILATPMTCWILVPRPGIKPVPWALEAWSLNHWTVKEVPTCSYGVLLEHSQTHLFT